MSVDLRSGQGPYGQGPAVLGSPSSPARGAQGAQVAPPPVQNPLSRVFQHLHSHLQSATHPRVCFFQLLFKVCALAIYSVGRYVFGNYVYTFLGVVVFLALDFWVVKNVTGRLLVGLRWWNHVADDGASTWIFESSGGAASSQTCSPPPGDAVDAQIFWGTTYGWCFVWLLLFAWNLVALDFQWLVLTCVGVGLSGVNLLGYFKCSRSESDATKGMAGLTSSSFHVDAAKGVVSDASLGQRTSLFPVNPIGVVPALPSAFRSPLRAGRPWAEDSPLRSPLKEKWSGPGFELTPQDPSFASKTTANPRLSNISLDEGESAEERA